MEVGLGRPGSQAAPWRLSTRWTEMSSVPTCWGWLSSDAGVGASAPPPRVAPLGPLCCALFAANIAAAVAAAAAVASLAVAIDHSTAALLVVAAAAAAAFACLACAAAVLGRCIATTLAAAGLLQRCGVFNGPHTADSQAQLL